MRIEASPVVVCQPAVGIYLNNGMISPLHMWLQCIAYLAEVVWVYLMGMVPININDSTNPLTMWPILNNDRLYPRDKFAELRFTCHVPSGARTRTFTIVKPPIRIWAVITKRLSTKIKSNNQVHLRMEEVDIFLMTGTSHYQLDC